MVQGPVAERCLVEGLTGAQPWEQKRCVLSWEGTESIKGAVRPPVTRSPSRPLPKAGKDEKKVLQADSPVSDALACVSSKVFKLSVPQFPHL